MFQSRKVRLKLNQRQKELVTKNFGASRFIWNWGLEQFNKWWEQNKDLDKAERTKRPTAFDLKKELTKLKATEEYAWLKECDSVIANYTFDTLDKAFQKYWKGTSKHPKFKSKKTCRKSYTTSNRGLPHLVDSNHIQLPKLGKVKFYNRGYIPNVKLKRATILFDGEHYYCSVLFNAPVEDWGKVERIVGLDLGIKTTVTCSDGKTFDWKPSKRAERRIKLSQRALSRTQKTSKRRAKAHIKLARRYKRVANQHKDFLHKMTTKLVRENQTIRMEDLNTKGMMKNSCLSRAVGQQSFYEIKRQLEYKCQWHDREFQTVDRFFPSSQLCSKCGARNKAIKNLSKRQFICPECGFTLDRDLNAAINICTANNAGNYARRDWSSVKESKSFSSHSQSLKRELEKPIDIL